MTNPQLGRKKEGKTEKSDQQIRAWRIFRFNFNAKLITKEEKKTKTCWGTSLRCYMYIFNSIIQIAITVQNYNTSNTQCKVVWNDFEIQINI